MSLVSINNSINVAASVTPSVPGNAPLANAAVQRIQQHAVNQHDVTPRYEPAQVRQSAPLFLGDARHKLSQLESETGWRRGLPPELTDRMLVQTRETVEAAGYLTDRFNHLDTSLETHPRMGRIYSGTVLEDMGSAGELAQQVRTVLGVLADGGSPVELDIRAGCGVGDATRYSSPADVLRLVEKQHATLTQPEHTAFLVAAGVPVEVWVVQLAEWSKTLRDGLEANHRQRREDLRSARDLAQRCVELAWFQVAGLFHMTLGREAFDALRGLIPTVRQAPKKETKDSKEGTEDKAKKDSKDTRKANGETEAGKGAAEAPSTTAATTAPAPVTLSPVLTVVPDVVSEGPRVVGTTEGPALSAG